MIADAGIEQDGMPKSTTQALYREVHRDKTANHKGRVFLIPEQSQSQSKILQYVVIYLDGAPHNQIYEGMPMPTNCDGIPTVVTVDGRRNGFTKMKDARIMLTYADSNETPDHPPQPYMEVVDDGYTPVWDEEEDSRILFSKLGISVDADKPAAPTSTSGDLIGNYECHLYDQGGKNDYHYVTISKVNETTLTWTNRAGVSWTLTTTRVKTKLRIGEDCGYFRRGSIEYQTVVWAGDQVSGVCGPEGELYDKTGDYSHLGVKLKNVITNRYLFSAGDVVTSSAAARSAPVLGADANYYNRADWLLKRVRDGYTLKNRVTRRYLRSEGEPVQADEGGWLNSPAVVDTAGNFHGDHVWELIKVGDNYQLRNRSTGRYLFMTGEPVKEVEGGWLNSPGVVGADANYYNRADWAIEGPGTEQIT